MWLVCPRRRHDGTRKMSVTFVRIDIAVQAGETTIKTWTRGEVALDHIGLWETGGVDFVGVFRGLQEIGYRGYVTVHQAFAGIMSIETAVKRSADYLRLLIDA